MVKKRAKEFSPPVAKRKRYMNDNLIDDDLETYATPSRGNFAASQLLNRPTIQSRPVSRDSILLFQAKIVF